MQTNFARCGIFALAVIITGVAALKAEVIFDPQERYRVDSGKVLIEPLTCPAGKEYICADQAKPKSNFSGWLTANDYPWIARKENQGGVVVLKCEVDKPGRLTFCKVITSSGSKVLDEATISGFLKRARFKPQSPRNNPSHFTVRVVWLAPWVVLPD
jgi:TonB family protein